MSDQREYPYYPDWAVKTKGHNTILLIRENGDFDDKDSFQEYAAEYIVCPVCRGKGSYVNPSIDSHGLSAEDFYEDPDFAEDYCSGKYDVRCKSCDGERVILSPTSEEGKKRLNEILDEESNSRAEQDAERRMGC